MCEMMISSLILYSCLALELGVTSGTAFETWPTIHLCKSSFMLLSAKFPHVNTVSSMPYLLVLFTSTV